MTSQEHRDGSFSTSPTFRDPAIAFLGEPSHSGGAVAGHHQRAVPQQHCDAARRRNSIITLVESTSAVTPPSSSKLQHAGDKSPSVDDLCVDSRSLTNGSPSLSTSRWQQDYRDDGGLTSSTSSRRCNPFHTTANNSTASRSTAYVGPAPCWTPLCIVSAPTGSSHFEEAPAPPTTGPTTMEATRDWLLRCADAEHRLLLAEEASARGAMAHAVQAATANASAVDNRRAVQRVAGQLHTVVGHVALLQRMQSDSDRLHHLELHEATQRHAILTAAMMAALKDVLRAAVVTAPHANSTPGGGRQAARCSERLGDDVATRKDAVDVVAEEQPSFVDAVPFRRSDSAMKRSSGPLQKLATEMAMDLANAKAAFEAKVRNEHAEEMRALRAETDAKLEVRRRGEATLREEIIRLKCALAKAYGTVEPPHMSLEDMKDLPSFRVKVREEVERILATASSASGGSMPSTPFGGSAGAPHVVTDGEGVAVMEEPRAIAPAAASAAPPTTSIAQPCGGDAPATLTFAPLEDWPMVSCVSSRDYDDGVD